MEVLVVDDSEMTRMIAKKTLKTLGVTEVVEAEDGVQALAVYDQSPPDLVFSDWNMPNMDGLALLKEIRQRNKDIPVIMITTEGSRAKVVQAISEGVSDYLVKPFTPASLKEKLAKWTEATV